MRRHEPPRLAAHWGAMSLLLTCILPFVYNGAVTRIRDPEFSFRLRRGSNIRGRRDPDPPDPLGGDDDDWLSDWPSVDFAREESLSADFGRWEEQSPLDDIPKCAQDVFITLREEGDDGKEKGRGDCRGLLVRDDFVLTSRECSTRRFTFDFPDERVSERVRAIPLKLKGDRRRLVDPRLGFLKTSAPSHYVFVDTTAMRTRMFLSRDFFPGTVEDAREAGGDAAMAMTMACEDGRPVARSFPVDGELVPLGHLFGVLPDNVLWRERDLATAPALDDGAHTWWARRTSVEEEEAAFDRLLEDYRGPPGSLSMPDAHEKYTSKAGAICEAVDPRGHRYRNQRCFENYFFRWREADPFSGLRFFDWLDYGPGRGLIERNDTAEMIFRHISDRKCQKPEFDTRGRVHYFDDDERAAVAVDLAPSADGAGVVATYRLSERHVPRTGSWSSHLYTWGLDGTLYVVDTSSDDAPEYHDGIVKHTAVVAGRPVLGAGKAHFGKGGRLTGINPSSGHYRPGMQNLALMHLWMKDLGLNVTAFNWIGRKRWSTEKCLEIEWKDVKIMGYDGAALNRSCHEVTAGPTWMLEEDD